MAIPAFGAKFGPKLSRMATSMFKTVRKTGLKGLAKRSGPHLKKAAKSTSDMFGPLFVGSAMATPLTKPRPAVTSGFSPTMKL